MPVQPPETNALKSKIEELLASVPEFTDGKGQLKINVIKDYADRGDVKLLEPLLKNPETKRAFFMPVLDSFVFNTVGFKEFLEYSGACNSYSKYLGKRIGLYMGDSSLADRGEVVLNFPFKDCVLEGGQRKEDGKDTYFEYEQKQGKYKEKQAKRREVFYNELLARDEIDSLFGPKAFRNAKRYGDMVTECEKLNRSPDGTIRDNLIIKGNNLLALHSLKPQFAGKVKLVYIDPPYNTGSDSFAYNDSFTHSSWLTFMKNRLEVARELLREDGAIFVQCDDNEQAYLKVLMDSIFGRDNFVANIIWRKKSGGGQDSEFFAVEHENILVYKRIEWKLIDAIKDVEETDFSKNINGKPANLMKLEKWGTSPYREDRPSLYYAIKDPDGKDFFPKAPDGRDGRWRKKPENLDENHIHWEKRDGKWKPYEVLYYEEADKKTLKDRSIWIDFGNNTEGANEMKNLFGTKVFNNPKPENLICHILEISTKPGDIVLDYHLGSGTTAAVAHKMQRQYIGVEQMDYIESVTVERLKKVIAGEQGGISKAQDWQGGCSFVYLELAERNETALRRISACKTLAELASLFDELCAKYFLHYNVRVKDFRAEIETERFKALSLTEQKEMFSRMLDLNQLYVNADDRYDKNSGLSADDIAITEDFYQIARNGEC
ncbi:MAG: site-specific DNA-methyltransferase [Treponema sp.]|nr:site-specific DNA-methyltransferase [Treponema sp.]